MFDKLIKLYKRKQEVETAELIGIVIHYTNNHSKINYEEVSKENLEKFVIKHNLHSTDPLDIVKAMIKYYNKTLRPYENKRKLVKVYYQYKGEFFTTKKN